MRKFYIILIKASKIVVMYVIEKIQVYLEKIFLISTKIKIVKVK